MWPEPTRTLTLPQLRELARARGNSAWRVLSADNHRVVLRAPGDPLRMISHLVDDETIAHLQALKAAGQPFEP